MTCRSTWNMFMTSGFHNQVIRVHMDSTKKSNVQRYMEVLVTEISLKTSPKCTCSQVLYICMQ